MAKGKKMSRLVTTLVTAPAIEPLTLTEVKEHLRLESYTFGGSLVETQDLVPASYGVGTHIGVGVDVLAHRTVMLVNMGAIAGAETVTVTLQEADAAGGPYTAWGIFTVFNVGNFSLTDELEYTGTKQWVRSSTVVAGGAIIFGIIVVERAPPTAEDNFLTAVLLAARHHVENYLGRALITQTWNLFLDEWPDGNSFKVPYPLLQHYTVTMVAGENVTFNAAAGTITSAGVPFNIDELRIGRKFIVNGSSLNDAALTVTAISTSMITVSETLINEGPTASVTFETTILSYADAAGTWFDPWEIDSAGAFAKNYIVDTDSEPGRIVLDCGDTWVGGRLYPSNPIRLRYECGYGSARSAVPGDILVAIKLVISDMYMNREPTIIGVSAQTLKTLDRILNDHIDWTWKV